MRDGAARAPASRCATTAAGATAIRTRRRRASRRSIRLKAPQTAQTVIEDAVQGEVTVENAAARRHDPAARRRHADLHARGRGRRPRHGRHARDPRRRPSQQRLPPAADHPARMGWPEPVYAHIPLIHGADGAKLCKRHGALGVDAYRDMGFLPEALRNYLLRLGWGHGDDEIISTEQAIEWFDLDGRRPLAVALRHGEAHQPQRALSARDARRRIAAAGAAAASRPGSAPSMPPGMQRIQRGMNGVKQRSRTLVELADNLVFYARDGAPPIADDKARAAADARQQGAARPARAGARGAGGDWSEKPIEEAVRRFAEGQGREAGPGRPAAARGAHRLDRIARHLRGAGNAGPGRDQGEIARRRRIEAMRARPRHTAAMALRVWLWLLSLSVLWGGSFFFAKVAMGELGPFTVVFARVSLAALALAVWSCRCGADAPWPHLLRHGLPEQRPALQPDLLGPDRDRSGPGLDPQRHHAALHPGGRPLPHARREDRPAQGRRPADRASRASPC